MTPAEQVLWSQLQRRAALATPQIASAVLVAFARVRAALPEAEVASLVESGAIERLFSDLLTQAALASAFMPVRERIRESVARSVRYVARDLPAPPAGSTLAVTFDSLNPRVIDALRGLETQVVAPLEQAALDVVRASAERGLVAGLHPTAVSREIRSVVGLGPSQLREVEHYRDALLGQGGRSLASYTLRNKRYDSAQSEAQVDKAVAMYRRARINLNAATTARTAALDSQKLGQRLSWDDAADKGLVDRDRLFKTWVGVMDQRERLEHRLMEGDTAPFDAPFRNGQMIPGDTDYNCRCVPRYFQAAA